MIYLNINLKWPTCTQILEVPLQVGNVLSLFHSIRASHLSILLPLSQAHHCTKLGKECSKLD
jgi:hypothetical protein